MSAVTTPFQQQAKSQENKIKVIEISKVPGGGPAPADPGYSKWGWHRRPS